MIEFAPRHRLPDVVWLVYLGSSVCGWVKFQVVRCAHNEATLVLGRFDWWSLEATKMLWYFAWWFGHFEGWQIDFELWLTLRFGLEFVVFIDT